MNFICPAPVQLEDTCEDKDPLYASAMGATSGPLPYSDREEDICTFVSSSEQSDDKLADDSKGDENDGRNNRMTNWCMGETI